MSALTLSLIQTNLFWEDKEANLQMLEKKISGISEKTEVVILPEMFSTGFSMKPRQFAETMEGESVRWMKKVSAGKRVVLTGSLMIKEPSANAQDEKYYNRLIWMLPNGEYGYYDKRHLFAMGDEHNHYTPGNKRVIAQVKGWKINLQICYDLRFPVWARQQHNLQNEFEYDLLLIVANWPEKRNLAWKTFLQARAIENQSFAIGVNRVGTDGNNLYHSGDSMVVNPMGEVLYSKAHEEDIFTITLNKNEVDEVRSKLPFWKDADPFKILE